MRRMVCKLFSFSSLFRPFEFASHFLRSGNVFRLRGLHAASQQNIDRRSRAGVVNAIPRSNMNAHLGNAFADGSAIAEISKCRARKASQDSGLCFLVGQIGQPRIEIGRPKQRIHFSRLYPSGYFSASITTRILSESPLTPPYNNWFLIPADDETHPCKRTQRWGT